MAFKTGSVSLPGWGPCSEAFVGLREGLEAFLIVAISACLSRPAAQHSIPAVRWGIAASLLSIGAGLLSRQGGESVAMGRGARTGCCRPGTLTVHVCWRAGRYMKRDIEEQAEAPPGGRAAAFLGVLCSRCSRRAEGMRPRLRNALLFTVQSPQIVGGASGGTSLARSSPGSITVRPPRQASHFSR